MSSGFFVLTNISAAFWKSGILTAELRRHIINSSTPMKGGFGMEQSDIQFKAFLRFVLDALREVRAEKDEEKRAAKMDKIIENLQKSLED